MVEGLSEKIGFIVNPNTSQLAMEFKLERPLSPLRLCGFSLICLSRF
jgi:hypothetical protein